MRFIFLSPLLLGGAFLNGGLALVVRTPVKPAVVMVPGAFHSPEFFVKVIKHLDQANYKYLDAVALPSVGHIVGRQPDIDAVKAAMNKHLKAGRDVVLVGNSYGATVIGEAVKGALHYPSSSNCQTSASTSAVKGRVISLIYLSGFLPWISDVEHPETKQDIHGMSPIFNIHDNNGTITPDGDMVNAPPQKAFYNLLSAKEADYWTSKLDFESFEAANATATYISYTGDFEVVYVVGDQDTAISLQLVQSWIDQPGAKFTVEHIDSDHVSMLSKPDEVTALIQKYSVPACA
ncbi:alpha/beta-hydrolase [Bimuria novae-zelandiae CBS 107.79]|uniref:Alpha/beta-hydrolase n=1 Tax=Bimuria novae-zelandiae CBS 107.79 TaxID=1447943 RepID=A0A6A5V5Y2_9PLEO|nr:alpha/beta-hydrolase [Bimuria novae-zelandiae CBS 107.79]